ncbi:MAG: hypothetical protein A2X13_07885 [Bacteroidetes bacterium GWC2_33_15]|nr:MAG: hypothetical protein A2X10_04940 [Bacteroidetes bacterium GWA2_33_15]OFX52671.1 MAG: hypothetical protein A2X13_07885 [Bacteroidetes bacterium GWC2_33_15]OFX64023.1 MAG: hypothetical protein A2X15_02450 [Bacteroidetes bacterium GWB2_32_14]OFX67292.1 MAG: hypothetical protein A2X14_11965 [Bacteroidetes bacterium GWD2_33_33]HAN18849.1 hypothetical protein [Bacteroidales bacterium]
MIRKITFLIAFVFVGLLLYAQEPADSLQYWKFNGTTALNFTQVSLTNWAAGGENSYALNGLINLSLNYSKDKNDWLNTLNLGYGLQKQGEQDVRKTDDQIDFLSKYGRKVSKSFFISAMLNFKTQFTEGLKYDADTSYVISKFMAPAYLQGALGMEYKPSEVFYAVLSPVAGKLTLVMDDTLSAKGAFGVEAGEKTRLELGGAASIGFKKDIMKNVNFNTTLGLFSNYLENAQNVDVDWKVFINMKINDVLSANLNTHLIYDDDIAYIDDKGVAGGARVQFKEVFGVGLTYKF